MELFDAILYRKSTRKFSQECLDNEQLQAVRSIIDNAERLFKNIDMKIHLAENGWKLHGMLPGFIGCFGKVKAPHYLIITSEEKEGYLENIGYTLQGVVLRLTTMYLATCWLGSSIKKEFLKDIIDIPENQMPQLMIAFGHPRKGESPFRQRTSDAKRKDLSEITSGCMDVTWSRIVSAVRLAPSALNSQPWRFVFDGGKVHVYSAKTGNPIIRHFVGSLDLVAAGIALCHAKVAARHFSRNIQFTGDPSAVLKEHEYVTTIIEA